MDKLILYIVMAGLATSVSAWAGGACCPGAAKAKSNQAKQEMACTAGLKGIELTAEQQARIAEIEAECKAAGCSETSCARSMEKIREVLTDEQRALYDAQTRPVGKAKRGCG